MSENSNTIVLTGGGTAGHVMAHLALEKSYRSKGWQIIYVGSSGIEKDLMAARVDRFHSIPTGKLRRYFSFQNFVDVFKVFGGFVVSLLLLLKYRPFLVFSKGGFVSVPVCIAARLLRVPIVSHESDYTPGLATKIVAKLGAKVLFTFPQTQRFLPKERSRFVGSPVRGDLLKGRSELGKIMCGWTSADKPILMVTGGSQGSSLINRTVERTLDTLLQNWFVVHLTGAGKGNDLKRPGYFQAEFVNEGLENLLACTDAVVGRAGSNSIFEFLALSKPMLLIPLKQGSRGDQIDNAQAFLEKGWAHVLSEDDLTPSAFVAAIEKLRNESAGMLQRQHEYAGTEAARLILDELASY